MTLSFSEKNGVILDKELDVWFTIVISSHYPPNTQNRTVI